METVICEHGCPICGEMWKHIPKMPGRDVPCPEAGKLNRTCPPCEEKDRK